MQTLLRLAVPLLLAMCATPGTAGGRNPEGTARIGQTARVGGPIVRPIAVIENSLCPDDVSCVWSGRLVVRVEVTTGRGKRRVDMVMGEPVRVADGKLTLRDATPAKRLGTPLPPGGYLFHFEFAGGR